MKEIPESKKFEDIPEDVAELIAAICEFPGLGKMVKIYLASNQWWTNKRLNLYQKKLRELQSSGRVKDFILNKYYKNATYSGDLRPFQLNIQNKSFVTTIFTSKSLISLPVPSLQLKNYLDVSYRSRTPSDLLTLIQNKAVRVIARLKGLDVNFWDADIYQLINYSGTTMYFGLTSYFKYRFTTGLIEDELIDALLSKKDDYFLLENRSKYFPLREKYMPSIDSFDDFKSRICVGGMGCLVAFARAFPYNDYVIPLQVRSRKVASNPGLYSVIPHFFHQSGIQNHTEEVQIHWTVIRELYEEIFGGIEATKNSGYIRHDWYAGQCPGIKYLQEHFNSWSLEYLGFGINAITGNYECVGLLCIHDPSYWEHFSYDMKRIWESEKVELVSSKDLSKIAWHLHSGKWADAGLFSFSLGIRRLANLAPNKVRLPNYSLYV